MSSFWFNLLTSHQNYFIIDLLFYIDRMTNLGETAYIAEPKVKTQQTLRQKDRILTKLWKVLGIIKKITSQNSSLFSVILHPHVHLIACYEVSIHLRLTPNIHGILDLLFSFIWLDTQEAIFKLLKRIFQVK